MATSRVLPVLLATALACAACGDDAPSVVTASADHVADVVAAGPADAIADATSGDTAGPLDTSVLADTTPPDTVPNDTWPGTDTAPPADTSPPDTTPPSGPSLTGPTVLPLPWVAAGGGATEGSALFQNLGLAGPVTVTLTGASGLHLTAPPTYAEAGATVPVTVRWDGAATPTNARGDLHLAWDGGAVDLPVWAVAGDPTIAAASWQPFTSAQGVLYGHGVTLAFPTAPYPAPGGSWSDPSVLLFVPADFRDRGVTDLVVHFHGFGAVVDDVVATQGYREQLYLSGVNAVFVAPQGPKNASSGDFGKLMDPGGLEALVRDVVSVLYRDGWLATPIAGDLILTEHSGGYQAVAENLDAITEGGEVTHAMLFDGLYARVDQYTAFANAGGIFRSDYTATGGTKTLNQGIASTLGAATAPTQANLRDRDAVVWFADTGHYDAMRYEMAFAEALRWAATRSRRGPRVELRTATRSGDTVTVRWFSPRDDDLVGFDVEAAEPGGAWQIVASVGASAESATFSASGGREVRVVPRVVGVSLADALRSDAGFVGGAADVLVVDGFDRALGGSFVGLRHGFAARVGAAVAGAAYASNEAITDDGFPLAGYDAVIWLVGDESTSDHTFTLAEQAAVDAYLDGGGALVASGSEIGWDLGSQGNGGAFLTGLGAKYAADDSDSYTVSGAGELAGLGPFAYGGPGAAYPEDFPDALSAAAGGEIALRYASGQGAAAGVFGQSVVVGFPLELVDSDADLAALASALVGFARGD
ncbi:MAG: hypothetical protein CVU56_16000 [Deltaproteobacteria bacterium HGW-Deltaproteobacteria-14]|jgi:hypothetical protein|nr:MAG: hypothetical protein CVU56_16000 [Deltaproteobacteria bacterium HGW-Deltaproteobacteria-14]